MGRPNYKNIIKIIFKKKQNSRKIKKSKNSKNAIKKDDFKKSNYSKNQKNTLVVYVDFLLSNYGGV